jgi:transposase-like protein
MYDSILRDALELSMEQKESLIAALKAAVFEEAASATDDGPARCPRCGHAHVVRKGHGRKGAQVWLCRGCERTFTARTNRVIALSKLDASTWADFVEGMVEGLPLRKLAERCEVCLKTAWYMRMRVCSVMESRLAPFRCDRGTSVQIDEKYYPVAAKDRVLRADGKQPRGLSRNQVCISLPGSRSPQRQYGTSLSPFEARSAAVHASTAAQTSMFVVRSCIWRNYITNARSSSSRSNYLSRPKPLSSNGMQAGRTTALVHVDR